MTCIGECIFTTPVVGHPCEIHGVAQLLFSPIICFLSNMCKPSFHIFAIYPGCSEAIDIHQRSKSLCHLYLTMGLKLEGLEQVCIMIQAFCVKHNIYVAVSTTKWAIFCSPPGTSTILWNSTYAAWNDHHLVSLPQSVRSHFMNLLVNCLFQVIPRPECAKLHNLWECELLKLQLCPM